MTLAILVLLVLAVLTRARLLVRAALRVYDATAAAARRFAVDRRAAELDGSRAQAVADARQEAQLERDGRIRAEHEARRLAEGAQHAQHQFEQAMRMLQRRDELDAEREKQERTNSEQAQSQFEQLQAQQLFDARRAHGEEPN